LFSNLFGRSRSSRPKVAPRRPSARPQIELLEDRTVLSPTILNSFKGIDFNTSAGTPPPDATGFAPPDTVLAVGPNNVMEEVNSAVAIYSKTGTQLSLLPLNTFFKAPASQFIYDPVMTYDNEANRFVVAALQEDQNAMTSSIYIAVSNTSDATAGFSDILNINLKETNPAAQWADYPKLGWNADAYVFSFNMFTFGNMGSFQHVQLLTIEKSSVLTGNPATVVDFKVDIPTSTGYFTMAGATMYGAAPGAPMYFVVTGNGSNVNVVTMTNVLSATPTFVNTVVPVNAYSQPPESTQPGGMYDAKNDDRILNAVWRNNELVATHDVGIGTQGLVRWYEFSTSGTPTLVQQGNIDPGPGIDTLYGSISIAPNGTLGMTYMESSSTEFISTYITGQGPADPAGTMEPGVLVQAGVATYTDFTGPPYRAGDYSGIGIDPTDGTFWTANEYATAASNAGANWGTWIAQFDVPIVVGLKVVALAPTTAQAGSTFMATVTAVDANGNPVPSYTGTVRLSVTDPKVVGLPASYKFTAADAGAHTFMFKLFTAGTQTLTATDTSNPAFTGSASFIVTPGIATHFSTTGKQDGSDFYLTVTVLDQFNNVVTNFLGTITFTGSGFNLPPYTYTLKDAGVHTFIIPEPSGYGLFTLVLSSPGVATDDVTIYNLFGHHLPGGR
jgi:hypothetical protein